MGYYPCLYYCVFQLPLIPSERLCRSFNLNCTGTARMFGTYAGYHSDIPIKQYGSSRVIRYTFTDVPRIFSSFILLSNLPFFP